MNLRHMGILLFLLCLNFSLVSTEPMTSSGSILAHERTLRASGRGGGRSRSRSSRSRTRSSSISGSYRRNYYSAGIMYYYSATGEKVSCDTKWDENKCNRGNEESVWPMIIIFIVTGLVLVFCLKTYVFALCTKLG